MKSNLLHICFVLDESGSMYGSVEDVIGGFQKLVDEQKQLKEGECIISVYRFATTVKCDYLGKNVNDIPALKYEPGGCTAMNDGIGTAIDEVGMWLNDMDESERPSKNLIVIMTDGIENASKEYTLQDVKDRIKHQEEKYNWSFVYMGTDLNSLDDANNLGITLKSASSRDNVANNYSHINAYANCYRSAVLDADYEVATQCLATSLKEDTDKYSAENGIEIK